VWKLKLVSHIDHDAAIKVHVSPVLRQTAIIQFVFKALGKIYQKCKALDIIKRVDIVDQSSKGLSLCS
jgi:hypothetical protein